MKYFNKIISLILSLVLVLMMCSCGNATDEVYLVTSNHFMGQAKGYYVDTNGVSAVLKEGYTTVDNEKKLVKDCISFGKKNKFNTAFVEVRNDNGVIYPSRYLNMDKRIITDGDTYDMLKYMSDVSAEQVMQIYAVIDLYRADNMNVDMSDVNVKQGVYDPQNPKTVKLVKNIVTELFENYNISGIVIKNIDTPFNAFKVSPPEASEAILDIVNAVHHVKSSVAVALEFNYDDETSIIDKQFIENINRSSLIDMFIPTTKSELNKGYLDFVERVSEINVGDTDIYTMNSFIEANSYELSNKLLANAAHSVFNGSIIGDYTQLLDVGVNDIALINSGFKAGTFNPLRADLSVKPELSISYPPDNFETSENSVFITGTSSPDSPFSLNGKEFKQITDSGVFGIYCTLADGENNIKLTQGDNTCEINVSKVKTPRKTIDKIPEDSVFPTTSIGYDSNETVNIIVEAPAGCVVTATVGETTLVLSQVQKGAAGTPVEYRGSFSLNNIKVGVDEVKSLGKITYILSSSKGNSVQTSKGEILVAGRNVPLVAEVVPYTSSLFDSLQSKNYNGYIKNGGKFAVRGKTMMTIDGLEQYVYKLSNNQYIAAANANVISNPSECRMNISKADSVDVGKDQKITLYGDTPSIKGAIDDNKLKLTIFDTIIDIDTDSLLGNIVKKAEIVPKGRLDDLVLTFDENALWGYDVSYSDGNTEIYLKAPPVIEPFDDKSLEGVTIALDSGHGGENIGAMGVAGEKGPSEALLNDAYTAMIKFKLEQLGAKVVLTRELLGADVALDDRMKNIEKEYPDLFISIHHNSAERSNNLNDFEGMEIYYNDDISEGFANSLIKNVKASTGRKTKESQKANYFVTRTTMCPSVLFELGYVVNPFEYNMLIKEDELYEVANGVAKSVLEILGDSTN